MTLLPIYAAPERLQPWIAAGLWAAVLLLLAGCIYA